MNKIFLQSIMCSKARIVSTTHASNHSQLIMNISNTANQLVTPQLLKISKVPKLIHTNPLNSIKIKCKLFTGETSIISDKLQQCQEFGIQLVMIGTVYRNYHRSVLT